MGTGVDARLAVADILEEYAAKVGWTDWVFYAHTVGRSGAEAAALLECQVVACVTLVFCMYGADWFPTGKAFGFGRSA